MAVRGVGVARTSTRRRNLGPILWLFSFLWVVTLVGLSAGNLAQIGADLPAMTSWIGLAAVVNLLPLVGWESAPFSADDPIIVAAAMIFQPIEAAIIIFVASVDPREFRMQTSPAKSIGNRSQLSLSWFLGSLVVHSIARGPIGGAMVLPFAFLALGTSNFVNYLLVAFSIAWERRYQVTQVLPRLKIGVSSDFLLAFLAWASLAALLTASYRSAGNWALLAFVAPILLGRQALARGQMFIETAKARDSAEIALATVTRQIDQERSEERRLVAADLHDDILQPLFRLSLMGQVIRSELATDRASQARPDIDDLIATANGTIDAIRGLIGDLRRPGLGSGGVASAITRLAGVLREQTHASLRLSLSPISSDSMTQLVLFHIAKEALNNAAFHSHAESISVELAEDGGLIRLIVRDDGVGFDPYAPRDGHFGIDLMRERATTIKASLFLDSAVGEGTSVTVLVPFR